MLAIAVSLTFAISAMLAMGVIAITLRQQAPSVIAVISQARATRGETAIVCCATREAIVFCATRETNVLAPVVRSRRVAGATVNPLAGFLRPATTPFFAKPLCVAA